MRRGRRKQPQSKGPELRTNKQIVCKEVRVIDEQGNQLGVMPPRKAYTIAQERGLDLVEVSPTAKPPVCKFLDYGRFRYEAQKKAKEAKAKQKTQDLREVHIRPKINEHDFQVKSRMVARLLKGGDKVKVTLRFRGREVVHADIGAELLERVYNDVSEQAVIESKPVLEGRNMVMILAPKSS